MLSNALDLCGERWMELSLVRLGGAREWDLKMAVVMPAGVWGNRVGFGRAKGGHRKTKANNYDHRRPSSLRRRARWARRLPHGQRLY
jgi:hypothetical protein